jgi:cytochrome d ubiquinol oxidase subunit I
MHFAATVIVAAGTLVSAFWILSANSWMQTPQGFRPGPDGLLYPTDWLQVIFNPSFPYRFSHMVTAAYLTTAFVVGGIGAFYLWRKRHVPHARVMFGMAMIMAVFVAPLQLILGDLHGLNTLEHQPAKVSAMEGLWQTRNGAPLVLFGWPDEDQEITRYAIEIPKLSSLILTHDPDGEVKGLKQWPRDERPPVAWVFWSFRIMVGTGLLMIASGAMAVILFLRKRLFHARWFHLWCMALTPAGFVAVLAGWIVTEMGRQPYIVQGVLRTAEATSPVSEGPIAISLLAFVFVYVFVFGAGSYYILRLIGKGPVLDQPTYGDHGIAAPAIAAQVHHE